MRPGLGSTSAAWRCSAEAGSRPAQDPRWLPPRKARARSRSFCSAFARSRSAGIGWSLWGMLPQQNQAADGCPLGTTRPDAPWVGA